MNHPITTQYVFSMFDCTVLRVQSAVTPTNYFRPATTLCLLTHKSHPGSVEGLEPASDMCPKGWRGRGKWWPSIKVTEFGVPCLLQHVGISIGLFLMFSD